MSDLVSNTSLSTVLPIQLCDLEALHCSYLISREQQKQTRIELPNVAFRKVFLPEDVRICGVKQVLEQVSAACQT